MRPSFPHFERLLTPPNEIFAEAVGVRKALLEAGMLLLNYEASMADARDFDWSRVKTRVDGFMESVGIKRLKG